MDTGFLFRSCAAAVGGLGVGTVIVLVLHALNNIMAHREERRKAERARTAALWDDVIVEYDKLERKTAELHRQAEERAAFRAWVAGLPTIIEIPVLPKLPMELLAHPDIDLSGDDDIDNVEPAGPLPAPAVFPWQQGRAMALRFLQAPVPPREDAQALEVDELLGWVAIPMMPGDPGLN